jgi:hypothetical protein
MRKKQKMKLIRILIIFLLGFFTALYMDIETNLNIEYEAFEYFK